LLPVLLLALTQINEELQNGSIVLMMLETMWYVLFNVFTVTRLIPVALSEAARLYKLSRLQRWQTGIFSGIFPDSRTGIIPAMSGDWKATLVSEYIDIKERLVKTSGLGAMISLEAATGNFTYSCRLLLLSLELLEFANRLVRRPLYRLAQEQYQSIA
jgi:NitT/TauT family transport system permease protein